jgi:hypothetical protein
LRRGEQCRAVFLSDLHSLYLTGSVIKGTAGAWLADEYDRVILGSG